MGIPTPTTSNDSATTPPEAAEGSNDKDTPVADLGSALSAFMDPKLQAELQWLQRKQVEFYKEMWPSAIKLLTATLREVRELKDQATRLKNQVEELEKAYREREA